MGHILYRHRWYSILRYGAFPSASSKKNFVALIGISFPWLRKILKKVEGNRNYRIIKKQRKKCEGSEGEK